MQLLHDGSTVKEIADFLGQRHPESPLFYAKFDVELLREVADFKLEGLV
jgi:integrase/recombinase XerD